MKMTYMEAIRMVIAQEMEKDPFLFLIGEDVGPYGGEMGLSKGLWNTFGDDRIRDAPIAEASIIGLALGASITGCRAIAEIPFSDFIGVPMDQIYNQAAKMRYMFGGGLDIKLVIRSPIGGYQNAAAQHSQCPEAWFMHIPGLFVAMPSNAADAAGLLRTALRQKTPVMFFEHKKLYQKQMDVPDDYYDTPFGKAAVIQSGSDITLVATSYMVEFAQTAITELAQKGISVELIDPRTIVPLDLNCIIQSLKKTGRLVIVNEACKRGSVASEIAAQAVEHAFQYLKTPIIRVAAENVPIPFNPRLENHVLPDSQKIYEAVLKSVQS